MSCMCEFHIDMCTSIQLLKPTHLIEYKNNVTYCLFSSYFV